jgi:hypothetical protein
MNSRSDQGEFKIKAAITKKENDSFTFKGARFTTSKLIILNIISKLIK